MQNVLSGVFLLFNVLLKLIIFIPVYADLTYSSTSLCAACSTYKNELLQQPCLRMHYSLVRKESAQLPTLYLKTTTNRCYGNLFCPVLHTVPLELC